jgi:hypothetical protein
MKQERRCAAERHPVSLSNAALANSKARLSPDPA